MIALQFVFAFGLPALSAMIFLLFITWRILRDKQLPSIPVPFKLPQTFPKRSFSFLKFTNFKNNSSNSFTEDGSTNNSQGLVASTSTPCLRSLEERAYVKQQLFVPDDNGNLNQNQIWSSSASKVPVPVPVLAEPVVFFPRTKVENVEANQNQKIKGHGSAVEFNTTSLDHL